MDTFCPLVEQIQIKRNKFLQLAKQNNQTLTEYLRLNNDREYALKPSIKTGVYIFHCKSNDMVYIGSAEDSIVQRKEEHIEKLNANEHVNWKFQLLYHKYGLKELDFYALELCHKNLCRNQESKYIFNYLPEINIAGAMDIEIPDIWAHLDKINAAQYEFEHTEKGFDWLRKRVSDWMKTPVGRDTTQTDMCNLWNRLDQNGLGDWDKATEILLIYKAYLPEILWTNESIIKYFRGGFDNDPFVR